MPEAVEIPVASAGLGKSVVVLGVLVAGGLVLRTSTSGTDRVMAVVCLVFAVLFAVVSGCVAARPPLLLTISPAGLGFPRNGWRSGRTTFPTVPWEEIDHVRISRLGLLPPPIGSRLLKVVARDPASPAWRAVMGATMSQRLWGAPTMIVERTIPGKLEDLTDTMRNFRPELRVERGRARKR